ncbi:Hypothetical protein R9X50_00452200 [Acrodontium crateriforme]|uniref:alpha-amylase n=1 Tax=Acrodontium crateriforme TaxID=150365 RepID=A0AAQ3R550_9PEZI|nr:Hypothetical protein R9X50_00452200 [Acrodontium crateriforme]
MRLTSALVALNLAFVQSTFAATQDQWRSRSIYQILTDRFARTDGSTTATCNTGDRVYCGGTWKGIESKLDYIQGMGFDAIWISPITKNIEGQTPYGYAFHGYWQQDLYQLNSHFGTEADLKSLSDALHSRGMYLMVDVVTNHFGYDGGPDNINWSMMNPFNQQAQYHYPYCQVDFSDYQDETQITQCWAGDQQVALPDLRTEDSDVRDGFNTWISQLVANYSIDGLRLDSALQVETSFWSGFSKAAGVYIVGEVFENDVGFVCGYQNYLDGVMNYGVYFAAINAFKSTSGDMSGLGDVLSSVKNACKDTGLLGSFSENHDNPRFAQLTGDWALAKNIIAFTILTDGIPIIYEGQEQHYDSLGGSGDPYNREAIWYSKYNTGAELYQEIAQLNSIRKHAVNDDSSYLTYDNWAIYSDTTTIAMRKGHMVTVLTNQGAQGANYTQSIPGGFDANSQVTDMLTCNSVQADANGNINVPMGLGLPRVYYPTARLAGSGMCGSTSSSSSSSSSRSKRLAPQSVRTMPRRRPNIHV